MDLVLSLGSRELSMVFLSELGLLWVLYYPEILGPSESSIWYGAAGLADSLFISRSSLCHR